MKKMIVDFAGSRVPHRPWAKLVKASEIRTLLGVRCREGKTERDRQKRRQFA